MRSTPRIRRSTPPPLSGATGEYANIVRLMGVDHHQLTWRYQSRGRRLTDVYGEGGFTDSLPG